VTFSPLVRSLALFVAAGLAEVGGGYLVWRWLRDGRGVLVGLLGGAALFLYGVIPTYQTESFGRTYAAYGGFFVALSLLWGWGIDGRRPDTPDVVGALICLAGVGVIMYWPRS
jgi:small multidrug resistance family-3 protein